MSCSGSTFFCPYTLLPSEDCSDCDKFTVPDVDSKECIQRFVFGESHLLNDIIGCIVWFVGAGLAISVGVGGGGIFVPLGLILLRFGAKAATGLSQASIFGASLGGLLLNSRARHPLANRPIIDLDMALFLAPMEISGALLGVIIQKLLPVWAVILIMVVVLSYTSYRTFKKGFENIKKEKEKNEKEASFRQEVKEVEERNEIEKEILRKASEGDLMQAQQEQNDKTLTQTQSPVLNTDQIGLSVEGAHEASDSQNTPQVLSPNQTGEIQNTSNGEENLNPSETIEGNHNSQTLTNATVTPESKINQVNLNSVSSPKKLSATNLEALNQNVKVTRGIGPFKFTNSNSSAKGSNYSSEQWLEKDAATPTKQYIYLLVLWLTLLLILLFKGGKGLESIVSDLIPYCGIGYWIMTFISFLWLFGFALIMARRAKSKSMRKQLCGTIEETRNPNDPDPTTNNSPYPFVDGDVLWDNQKIRFYSLGTFFAGIIAGLIGIGGGMVLGPLMIQMGVIPQVSAATTATMIVLTSSSAAFLYVSTGLVPLSYALTFFFVAFCGALVGKTQIDSYVKRKKLSSLLIFLLASIILFASVMVSIAGIIKYSDQDWCFEGLQSVCKK